MTALFPWSEWGFYLWQNAFSSCRPHVLIYGGSNLKGHNKITCKQISDPMGKRTTRKHVYWSSLSSSCLFWIHNSVFLNDPYFTVPVVITKVFGCNSRHWAETDLCLLLLLSTWRSALSTVHLEKRQMRSDIFFVDLVLYVFSFVPVDSLGSIIDVMYSTSITCQSRSSVKWK